MRRALTDRPALGVLVGAFGWQSLFLLAVPFAVFAGITVGFLAPPASAIETETGRPAHPAPIDVGGLVLLAGLMVALLVTIRGIADGGPLLLAALAVPILLVAFVRYELAVERPAVDPRLFNSHGFSAAGTVYPTAHEPRFCYGVDGDGAANGAQVVVTDSQGRTSTADINNVGNFIFNGGLRPPLRAKVVYQGRERVMIGMVPSGACNRCHTEEGTTSVTGGPKAPGRIMLP